jgi:RNA polymerase sigma-70 factor (ECF subfamily)
VQVHFSWELSLRGGVQWNMGERKWAAMHSDASRNSRHLELSRATLEACKARDPTAFRRFVVAYERAVFALISRVTGPGAHVRDLAQEAFVRAYQAFPRFDLDGSATPSTWLLTIAVRVALNARRQASRAARSASLDDAANVPDASTPEVERSRRELGRAIERAAGELSDEQRATFVLAEFHGLSIAEIAVALETPENTVKTRLFRARAHLRERLSAFRRGDAR